MDIIWIGLIVPDEMAEEIAVADKYITTQTQAFQRAMVEAFLGGDDKVLLVCSPPVTDYSKIRFAGGKKWKYGKRGTRAWVVPVINFPAVKQAMVFCGVLFVSLFEILSRRRRRCKIVVGDSYLPHVFAAKVLKLLTSIPYIAVITDMPGLIQVSDPWAKRLLRPIDIKSVRWCLEGANALIVVSKHIAIDFFPMLPYMVVPGLLSDESVQGSERVGRQTSQEFIVMYSGALVKEYGIDLLLSSFAYVKDPGIKLWVTGKGDMEPQVLMAAALDPRIEFLGFLGSDELYLRQQKADVLVNLRLVHDGHARYSFPSKLLNYMQIGTIVVSNAFPSLPPTFVPFLAMLEQESPQSLANLLLDIKNGAFGSISDFGRRAKNFVLAEALVSRKGQSIRSFVEKVG